MNSPFHLLSASAPNWARFLPFGDGLRVIEALPPQRDGTPGAVTYRLRVSLQDQKLEITEEVPGTTMPACCVERHINPDSTFCLFVGSHTSPESEVDAENWWHGLLAFLQHQKFADERRLWPIRAQMSHGNAATIQARMETIAAEHGWSDEVLTSIFRGKGWLADRLPRRSKDRKRLVNARTSCPRGCFRLHPPFSRKSCEQDICREECNRMHPPLLRRECPNRSAVEELVLLEYERRLRERTFIDALRSDAVICCGTMDNCALST